MKKTILVGLLLCSVQWMTAQEELSLAGTWRFQTDPMGFGKTPGSELYLAKLTESIQLPGSMDEGGKGMPTTARYVDRLTRKFEYCGPAWYQREITIPQSWKEKDILLHLERCHWETTVYVDGQPGGSREHLSTPNCFNLTQWLTPGVHTLTVCVDNRLKYPMDQWNHGTTEYTQTNWNGMVGDLKLIAREKTHIQRLQIYPEVENRAARLQLTLQNTSQETTSGQLELVLKEKNGPVAQKEILPVEMKAGDQTLTHTFQLGKNVKLWNEFTPHLYEVNATLKVAGREDRQSEVFGMRQVTQGKHHIQVNGRNVHLRGALDCCVFPLTGYPATDVADWKRIFLTVKDYGMNHIRFHSWCPPEAAFEAADEAGIYLQAELPMWIKDVGQYPARRDFFEQEMYAILEAYGNHPSFMRMCNGNENEGDFAVLEDLVKKAQQHDNRRLYSASTARTHTASDQYYVSHVTDKGWFTVYEGKPSTDWDRSQESAIDCPVIAHETGQRCMYPNFQEMEKYTGVVTPRNFEVFRERLARNGMLHQADDFFRATGAHTVLQYKEVNESLLRTPNSGGFQLLGLADFPGQGSAFVGILDAFWESKGLVSPEKFRESCAPTVLLARLPKRTFTTNETGTAKLEIYHYGEAPIRPGRLEWSLKNSQGQTLQQGKLSAPAIPCATVDPLGEIRFDLKECTQAEKLTLHVTLNGNLHNEWDIWVYPNAEVQEQTHTNRDYVMATTYDDRVREALSQGKRVLLVPEQEMGRKTHFASHFWNPIMFNWDPMIVGTLIQHEHPAFRDFPTDAYADWQWWDILNHAHALPLDGCPELTPLIQSIDSYEYNQKLGIAFEAQVGKGKLFVLNVDLQKDLDQRPATRQLLRSVQHYVASEAFRPEVTLPLYQIDSWLTPVKEAGKEKSTAGNAAIEQLLNQ